MEEDRRGVRPILAFIPALIAQEPPFPDSGIVPLGYPVLAGPFLGSGPLRSPPKSDTRGPSSR